MITLSPAREQELVDALAEAFTPEDLDHKVADPLKIPSAERSGARDVKERARALVKWAAANGVDTLVNYCARVETRAARRLRQFAASIGLARLTGRIAGRGCVPAEVRRRFDLDARPRRKHSARSAASR